MQKYVQSIDKDPTLFFAQNSYRIAQSFQFLSYTEIKELKKIVRK